MPKKAMPIAHTSWKGCRRRRHWSSSAIARPRARIVVSHGRRVVIGSAQWSRVAALLPRMWLRRDSRLGHRPGSSHADDLRREWHPELLEDLDRDEEAGKQEDHPEQLADEEAAGAAEPVQAGRDRRDDAADGDEDRRRDAAVQPAVDERVDGAGDRGDEVDREPDD